MSETAIPEQLGKGWLGKVVRKLHAEREAVTNERDAFRSHILNLEKRLEAVTADRDKALARSQDFLNKVRDKIREFDDKYTTSVASKDHWAKLYMEAAKMQSELQTQNLNLRKDLAASVARVERLTEALMEIDIVTIDFKASQIARAALKETP